MDLPTEAEPVRVVCGDALEFLADLPADSVHCCVTSPPYFALRDYGVDGQIGLETNPDEYVAKLVEVFREVRRVLRDDGTLWLNIGDSYASGGRAYRAPDAKDGKNGRVTGSFRPADPEGIKPKDLIGIPWMLAFALRSDGWYLRQDIIWYKPNPMPESVRDRCTKAHEYVFLLSKSPRYYYDAEAVKQRGKGGKPAGNKRAATRGRVGGGGGWDARPSPAASVPERTNLRSVWLIPPKPYRGAHFAVMPPKLVERCVLAGCPVGGVVLDPFLGSGTVAAVALENGRRAVGCELNPEYVRLIHDRLAVVTPSLFAAAD